MSDKSTRFKLIVLTLLVALFPTAAVACPCSEKPVLKKAVDESSMVLIGRVLEQRSNALKPGFLEVKITALQTFKDDEGVSQETITLYTPESEDKCGYSFQPGYEYLIFLTGSPAFFKSNSCSRTEVLENAQVDVHRLQQIKEKPLDSSDPDPKSTPAKGQSGKQQTTPSGKEKTAKELPPPRDALEEALRKRNLLSPSDLKRKSRL